MTSPDFDAGAENEYLNWVPRTLFLIILIWGGIYLPRLGSPELKGEEPRRVNPGLTMLETGNWLVPYVGGEPYLRKPPLINWLVALSVLSTHRINEFSARLPSVLAVFFLALAAYGCTRLWLGEENAFLASVALLTTLSLIDKGRLAEIEAVYTATFGLALLLWIYFQDGSIWGRWLWPAVPLGFGLLTKGPLHLLFFYGIVLLVLWRSQRLKELFSPAHLLSLVLIIGIFATWAIPHLQTPEARDAARTWSDQFSGRLAISEFHWKDWLINYPRALSNFLPWILFVPFGRGCEEKDRALIFGLEVGTLLTFLGIMLAPGSLPRYTMPLLVPISLLAAYRLKYSPTLSLSWRNILIPCICILLLALTAGIFLSSERIYLIVAWIVAVALLFYRSWNFVGRVLPTTSGHSEGQPWSRWLGSSGIRSLTVQSGLLVVAAICFYSAVIMPRQMKKEILRPRAVALAKLVPPGETIYALHAGPQPIFFYLRKPWQFINDWDLLPSGAHYLLLSANDLPALQQRFGSAAQRLFTYKDRGEKESYLYALVSQKKI